MTGPGTVVSAPVYTGPSATDVQRLRAALNLGWSVAALRGQLWYGQHKPPRTLGSSGEASLRTGRAAGHGGLPVLARGVPRAADRRRALPRGAADCSAGGGRPARPTLQCGWAAAKPEGARGIGDDQDACDGP